LLLAKDITHLEHIRVTIRVLLRPVAWKNVCVVPCSWMNTVFHHWWPLSTP
jgi:hypothetical protein